MGLRLPHGRHRALSQLQRQSLILEETRLQPVPFVPEIRLHQASEATALWQRTERELAADGLPPPFWAFAWTGGRGLSRFVLDHPELVAGQRVLDFASGSGLVAIAAALAGAREVEAVDIDPYAAAAIALNASENGVAVTITEADRIGAAVGADIVLAGDIFYDRAFASRALPWLRRIATGARVIVGDPGRAYRPQSGVREIARYDVPAETALEDSVVKTVAILEILPDDSAGADGIPPACDSASLS